MVVRIAMWSGPRSISTALMRSWESRADTVVLDEPLYAHYLAATGLEHPGREEILAAGPVDGTEAVARCLAPVPAGIEISYQKHMSHHLLPSVDRGWLSEVRNLLLIRHPVPVLASYTKVRPSVSLADLGLPQQLELAEHAELIIDADDLLTDPDRHLRAICDHLGVGYTKAMLSWRPGRRASDGCWAPHWYASVEASTGFRPPPAVPPPTDPSTLAAATRSVAEAAVDIYRTLAAERLVL